MRSFVPVVPIVVVMITVSSITGACAPAVVLTGAVAFGADCKGDGKAPLKDAKLDIGTDDTNANPYFAALSVTAAGSGVTINGVDVFFESTAALTGITPRNVDTERKQTFAPVDVSGVVPAPIITRDDAVLFQNEPAIKSALAGGGTVVVNAQVKVAGHAGGTALLSDVLAVPVTLCAGCLTTPPACTTGQPIANPVSCFVGDDVEALVCP